ncbi:peptidase S24 and S26 domain protein [Pirellula staleyi DSM 6068]|uniref:Signal peptidase I n=1 Tax=Pirellula staleyi (strain ATCC 27377 / DSM 6068 / ICPB 4128) TaxID=530564 RepID=D2R4F8_PIRSD|nr:signal peptidase I [Pirellula staleyi]ADB15306.1 peptidase S24 and S26 domain protein [Pirellula staleyi DSM 6068]
MTATTADTKTSAAEEKLTPEQSRRETIESIIMAIILAVVVRGFVAEAFVIPTGSMAPTLQGRHKDVVDPMSSYQYQATASEERTSTGAPTGNYVISSTCPISRYPQKLDVINDPADDSFSGDRIIVSKFSYDLKDPARWDVIVFKCPGQATQNYIKRLVGLPNEVIRIAGGNVYTAPRLDPEADFVIARKPPHKLSALLQIVDDSDYVPPLLVEKGFPSKWISTTGSSWKPAADGKSFSIEPTAQTNWMRWRNVFPSFEEWYQLEVDGRLPASAKEKEGQLVTDFYAYNSSESIRQKYQHATWRLEPGTFDNEQYDISVPGPGQPMDASNAGMHWVDDLALDVTAEVTAVEPGSELTLKLVRGGEHFHCTFDLTSGTAKLSRTSSRGEPMAFEAPAGSEDAAKIADPVAQTSVRGTGTHQIRLSNCDHQVLLWVNGSVVKFDKPTTYASAELIAPYWSLEEAGDLQPCGIGVKQAQMTAKSLRVLRDKYYIAVSRQLGEGTETNDYQKSVPRSDIGPWISEATAIQEIFNTPSSWSTSPLFDDDNRRFVEFTMEEDQFFPMGDNSPHSLDARLWAAPPYVTRDLLIGKALVIYWPHTWNRPVPFWPNFQRMGFIR